MGLTQCQRMRALGELVEAIADEAIPALSHESLGIATEEAVRCSRLGCTLKDLGDLDGWGQQLSTYVNGLNEYELLRMETMINDAVAVGAGAALDLETTKIARVAVVICQLLIHIAKTLPKR